MASDGYCPVVSFGLNDSDREDLHLAGWLPFVKKCSITAIIDHFWTMDNDLIKEQNLQKL